jgi:hypothetical protein
LTKNYLSLYQEKEQLLRFEMSASVTEKRPPPEDETPRGECFFCGKRVPMTRKDSDLVVDHRCGETPAPVFRQKNSG